MAQYPIPQFIEEESKIVFFLTFRQFFLLVGGGAICFLMFLVLPILLFVILSIFVMVLVSAIAFLKIDGIPIIKVVLNFFGFATQNKNYTWKKEELSQPFIQRDQVTEGTKETSEPTQPISRLEEIKKMIETKK